MNEKDYKPKKYIPHLNGDDIDIDDSNDGDYIVCPEHQDNIIYVLGTCFWEKEGGVAAYGWASITVNGWCYLCQKTHRINLGSYGG